MQTMIIFSVQMLLDLNKFSENCINWRTRKAFARCDVRNSNHNIVNRYETAIPNWENLPSSCICHVFSCLLFVFLFGSYFGFKRCHVFQTLDRISSFSSSSSVNWVNKISSEHFFHLRLITQHTTSYPCQLHSYDLIRVLHLHPL